MAQEFNIKVNKTKHSLAISADIFNFTNLINRDWGRRYFTNGFDTPAYTFNTNIENSLDNIDDAGLSPSRWQMQVGVRYLFN